MNKQKIISALSTFFSFDFFINEFKKYAHFGGRTKRKEFFLFIMVAFFLFFGIQKIAFDLSYPALLTYYEIIIFPPLISAVVRRLHDIGKSGYTFPLYLFISVSVFWLGASLTYPAVSPKILNYWAMICLLIAFYPFVLLLKKSSPVSNKYDTMPSHPIRHGILLILFILFALFVKTAIEIQKKMPAPVLNKTEELTNEELKQIDSLIINFQNKK